MDAGGVRHRRRGSASNVFEVDRLPNGILGAAELPRKKEARRPDFVIVAVLTTLAAITRFYRLSKPGAVVFDELHFQKFVDRHLSHIWYFDIHPPLGKLILAYGGTLLGYKNDPSFIIKKIGDVYPPSINYVALRTVSALFSVGTIPLTYSVSRSLEMSRVAATFSTSLTLLCFLGTIEGRLILMDSQLHFFCLLTLLSALHLWRSTPGTRRRRVLLASTGFTTGLALCVKHTALATPALIAIISFFGIHFLPLPLEVPEYLFAGAIAVVTYIVPFYPLLSRHWTTGDKYDKFMSGVPGFQKSIVDSAMYDPAARRPWFLKSCIYLNYRMLASNVNVKKRHTWESTFSQWIINWRGVLYYSKRLPTVDGKRGDRAVIYLIGNPVGLMLVLAGVTGTACGLLVLWRLRHTRARKVRSLSMYKVYTAAFLFSGWTCNLAPYVLVDRAAFLYHYMPALSYGYMLLGVLVDFLPRRARLLVVSVSIAALVAAFAYWSPWIYGFHLPDDQQKARQLLRRWD